MKKFEIVRGISESASFDDCYIRTSDGKFVKVAEAAERFEYEGFVIFSKRSEKSNDLTLKYYDHLTGGMIVKASSQEVVMSYLSATYTKEIYAAKITSIVMEHGVSPAYVMGGFELIETL